MPRIKPYEQQTRTPELTGTVNYSPEVAASRGRALSNAGNALMGLGEAVYQRDEQNEISDAKVKISEAQAQFTNRQNDELQKGNLDSQKFMNDLDEHIGKISENFSTRGAKQFLKTAGASAKSHFSETTVAAQAELRSVKTKENYSAAQKQWTSSLLNDPSAYKTVQEQHGAYIDALVANGLDQKTAARFRVEGETDIAKSAVRGWIELSPQDAIKQLKSGAWDSKFDGDVKKQLLSEAELTIRANKADQERAEREAEKALGERQKAIQNDFLTRMVEGKLTAREIVHSDLEPTGTGSKVQFLSLLETDSKKDNKITTDKEVFTDLFRRVHLPDGDPEKIVDEGLLTAYVGKGITISDLNTLRKEVQGIGTVAGKEESTLKRNLFTMAKNKLTKSNPLVGMKDPDGDEQYASFVSFFMQEYQTQRAAGKTAKDLLNPESPDYMGKYVNNYTKTPQQIMQDTINKTRQQQQTTPVDPKKKRKEGESAQQYLERMKAGG